MKRLPELLTLSMLAALLVVPPLWLPDQYALVESGELTWVVGVSVQNTLLLLILGYAFRASGPMRNASLGQAPPAPQRLPLMATLLAVYTLDLALLWSGFADGDPMLLDRAAVVLFSAALLTGPRVALPLGAAALLLRIVLVFITDGNLDLPDGDGYSWFSWLSEQGWVLLEPGVILLPVGIISALLLSRFGCQRGGACPLWTAFALGAVAEFSYLAAARQQWDYAD